MLVHVPKSLKGKKGNVAFVECHSGGCIGGSMEQNKPLACQSDMRAGLSWQNKRWVIEKFVEKRFILVQTEDGLTTESVAKALYDSTDDYGFICRNVRPNISCTGVSGESLYFDPGTLKGGLSYLFGTTGTDMGYRDTVTVTAFSCTPF